MKMKIFKTDEIKIFFDITIDDNNICPKCKNDVQDKFKTLGYVNGNLNLCVAKCNCGEIGLLLK